jgi:nucleotide-binding universal stress UspA family protein
MPTEVAPMRVMLAYDGSAGAESARDLLAHLPLPDGSAITLVAALEKGPEVFGAPEFAVVPHDAAEAEELLLADLQEMLRSAAAPLRGPGRSIDTRVARGRPSTAILDEALAILPDLLVIGSRGHGPLASVLLGSVSTEVVDHAPCPVLVARQPAIHRVVLGVDGSESAQRAVATMRAWPILHGLPTRVVTVAHDAPAWAATMGGGFYPAWVDMRETNAGEVREELLSVARRTADDLLISGSPVTVELRQGDPADELIKAAAADHADLIVVGSRGLSTLPRLVLGSVARKVLLHAPQSVLVVRHARERVRRPEPVRAGTLVASAFA